MSDDSTGSKDQKTGETEDKEDKKELSQVVQFDTGELIIKEGKEERTMYILQKGRVRVFKTYLGKKLTLGVLGAGEVFGELSFFDGKERIASVEALESGQAIKVDARKVKSDLDEMPAWMKGIFKTVVTRLRETDEKLALLQNKYDTSNPTGKATVLVEDIFNEVARVNKIFRLYFNLHPEVLDGENLEQAIKDLDFLFVGSFVKAERIFDFYEKNNLISLTEEDNKRSFKLNSEEIDQFDSYLDEQRNSDQISFFSRTSLTIMGDIIQIIPNNLQESEEKTPLIEVVDESKMTSMMGYEAFFKELKSFKLTSGSPAKITITLGDLQRHYRYQKVMSIFNLTME
jgi:CRP-like cAMP-binding protein